MKFLSEVRTGLLVAVLGIAVNLSAVETTEEKTEVMVNKAEDSVKETYRKAVLP